MPKILIELMKSALEAREQERKRFFELADRLGHISDPEEQGRLKEELAHMTFSHGTSGERGEDPRL